MSIIVLSLKKIHIILLYAFLVAIYNMVTLIIVNIFAIANKLNKNDLFIITYLGNTGLIFLYYIEKKRSKLKSNVKKNKDNIIYINDDNDYEENKEKKNKKKITKNYLNKKKTYMLIITVFFLRAIDIILNYPFFNYYIKLEKEKHEKLNFVSLMVIPFILKKNNKVYSHQYFSFTLLILSLYLDFIHYSNKIKVLLIILILLCKTIPNAITLNIFKFLNESEYINIYLLGSIDGFAYIIDTIIIEYIRKICFKIEFRYFDLLSLRKLVFFIPSIFKFFEGFLNNYMTFAILQLLEPTSTVVATLYLYLFSMDFNLLNIFSTIFTLLGSLIYLEIIIINCCGLGKNVKNNIFNRAKIQTEMDMVSISKFCDEQSSITNNFDNFEN